jgi:nucleoside-diphosphate-sugar epimerase
MIDHKNSMTSTLIVGCGFLGRRVARILVARGERVYGTTRSREKFAELNRIGIEPILADLVQESTLADLPAADRVLCSAGYDRASRVPMRAVYIDGFRSLLNNLHRHTKSIVYASSTGVYGQNDGSTVNEDSPTEPARESGVLCLEAETIARNFGTQTNRRVVILRYAGLYGPGRIIRKESLIRGEPIVGDPDRTLNVIHVEDAAAAAIAAFDSDSANGVYLACDDRPVRRFEYYELAARLLGAPEPRFIAPAADSRESSREETNKRVSNRKLRSELVFELKYPDIGSGLGAAIEGENV